MATLAFLLSQFSDVPLARLYEINVPSYFVGWGTLSLLNAGIAQGKNRSGLNWFLISLLLGPVATFLLVILEKK